MPVDPTSDKPIHPLISTPVAELLGSVTERPTDRLVLGVRAPGGYGKTVLLGLLARAYRAGGVPVANARDLLAGDVDPGSVAVLVDNAHLQDPALLGELARWAEHPAARLVLTYRAWPRSTSLSHLVTVVSRDRIPLLLCPFDRPQAIARATDLLGAEPATEFVDFLCRHTGGVPRFVDRVLAAAAPSPGADRALPRSAVEPFRDELATLDPLVRRLLTALVFGAAEQPALLPALLDTDRAGVGLVLRAARATGLLDDAGRPLPIAREAIGALIPPEERIGVQLRMVEVQVERGGPLGFLLRPLLGTGVSGAAVADGFRAAGAETLTVAPELSGEFFAAAVTAGIPEGVVAAQRAEAAARIGDFDSALRLADHAIVSEEQPQRARGAAVAATVLAHRGMLHRSSVLFNWSGTQTSRAFAALQLIATGDLAEADDVLAWQGVDSPPSLLAGAAAQMAAGIRESVTGRHTTALAVLSGAHGMLEPLRGTVLLPETAAALTAFVALHCGEFGVADRVLDQAIDTDMGGPVARRRHHLLLGWTDLLRGRPVAATTHLDGALSGPGAVEPRDLLIASGLRAGCARRDGARSGVRAAWNEARDVILRHPLDLFTLLPLGELAVAAARSGDASRIAPSLAEADQLLARLGNPPLWSAMLHWYRLHAAVIGERYDLARVHTAALEAMADSPYRVALAAGARCWLDIVDGRVRLTEVDAAARGLQRVGLAWDAAQLAGQAAVRTNDHNVITALLKYARTLRVPAGPHTGDLEDGDQNDDLADDGSLTQNERRIVRLLLDGLTYKEIGQRLFVTAKTVEYHVARMRQRYGGVTRAELLARLRTGSA